MDNTSAPADAESVKLVPPTILQDDLPLEGFTTTTLSFESGIDPDAPVEPHHPFAESSHPAVTDTMSSISSNQSSLLGTGGNNNNALSTFSSVASGSSRRGSMQFTKHEVKENLHATVSEDASGHTQLEQYTLQGEIGKGAFGKVHFAQDRGGEEYAIKEFSKSKLRKKEKANLFKLGPRGRGRGRARVEEPQSAASESSSPLDLIRVEIAILKKLNHPNIVRLYEVLDVAGSDSMYMVFEWCEKGVLMPVSLTETYENRFSDAECRDVFQQIVLGIEYLHEHDIIHRDIKPDNLLRSKDGTVKIVDFGVSEMFDKKVGDKTKKSAGSPAFMAPELCRPDHGDVSGRSTDVWSIGITLFCLRYGRLPFVSESLLEIQKKIRDDDLVIPEAEQDERFINLIKKLLEKDPEQRVNIDGLRDDPWLTDDGKIPLITKEENTEHAVTEITENDIKNAFSKVGMVMTVVKAVGIFMRKKRTRDAAAANERAEDADEANSVPQTPTLTQDSTQVDRDTAVVGTELNRVLIIEPTPDTPLEPAPEVPLEPTPVAPVESTPVAPVEPTSVAPVEPTPVAPLEPTPVAPLEPTPEAPLDHSERTNPEGYQVCDMETGLCYWVPSNATQPTPAAADQEEKKDETPLIPTPSVDVPSSLISDPAKTLAEPEAPKDHITSSTTPGLAPGLSPRPPRSSSPSPSVSPSASPRIGPTSTHNADGTSSRVGKLSRDRLAMFEKST